MSLTTATTRLLTRLGGALVRPRATFAALPEGAGRRDGALLLLLYAFGAGLLVLGDAAADFAAMASLAALPTLLAGCVVLVPWLVATLAAEAILGPERARRAALCLTPMLLVAASARLLAGLGAPLPASRVAVDVVGAALAAALALYVRPAVREADRPGPSEHPAPTRATLLVGLCVLGVPLVSGVRDAVHLADHWQVLAPVATGEAVPAFHADDLEGRSFTQDDLRGGARLLVFWTTWCGVCEGEMAKYAALHRELAAQDFAVIGINCDREGDQRELASAYRDVHGLPFRVVLDRGALARAFRLSVYPHLVLVDRLGQIRWVHQGRASESTLRAAIAEASAP